LPGVIWADTAAVNRALTSSDVGRVQGRMMGGFSWVKLALGCKRAEGGPRGSRLP
jgi:hypothetical protein